MPMNPVGNQIRSLQTQLDAAKKETQILLVALEAKAPDVYAEYMRMKEETSEAAARAAAPAQQPSRFQSTTPARSNGRF